MIQSTSGLANRASNRALSVPSVPMYELPVYCKLEPIKLSSSETMISFWPSRSHARPGVAGCNCSLPVLSRMDIVGFGLGRLLRPDVREESGGGEGGDASAIGASISEGNGDIGVRGGSLTKNWESIHVGGLCSNRERDRHHVPGRGPFLRRSSEGGATENARHHIRPRAMNSSAIRCETRIRCWNSTISKFAANAPSSPGTSSTVMSSGGMLAPSSISSVPESGENSGDCLRRWNKI